MMIKAYRVGLANLVLALLVGGPAAPAMGSPAAPSPMQSETPVLAAPAAATFNDAPPLLPLAEAYPAQSAANAGNAQPKSVSPAGPPYVAFFPLMMRPAAPAAVTTLMNETFEGSWPSAWSRYSYSGPLTGQIYWGTRNCRSMNGANSGMSYGGGAVGGGLSCGDAQPDNVVSWMVSPTYNLVGATAAELRYHVWQRSELNYDFFYALVSVDGTNFCGRQYSGNTEGWSEQVLDLTSVYSMGNLMGESAVQVAFVFISDFTSQDPPDNFDGAFIDDVSLVRCDGGACPIAPEDALGANVIRGDACITPGAVGP